MAFDQTSAPADSKEGYREFQLLKWTQPLPLKENLLALLVAIVPPGLVFLSGIAPWFNEIVLAVMAGAYIAARGFATYRRYPRSPVFQISRDTIRLPYSVTPSGRPLLLKAEEVRCIDFYRGVGPARDMDSSMIISDIHGHCHRISAFWVGDLAEPKLAFEELGWPVRSNPNPYGTHYWVFAAVIVGGVLLWLFSSLEIDLSLLLDIVPQSIDRLNGNLD